MTRKLVWVCSGNIAPNCAGKVGDVLVASAVIPWLQSEGWDIHFITNDLMAEDIKKSYRSYRISSSTIEDKNLSEADVKAAMKAERVVILRPFGDADGNRWQKQLIDATCSEEREEMFRKIVRIGHLNAFAPKGPHMVEQILQSIKKPLGLSEHPKKPLFPLLACKEEWTYQAKEKGCLILPFAGGKEKWLPVRTVVDIVQRLGGATVTVAGTKFDLDRREYESAVRDAGAQFVEIEKCEFASLAANSKEVFSVDGGMCWATVSGLNWLAGERKLSKQNYPRMTVILGRDASWNMNPTARVWKPLAKYPERVRQVNASQYKRLEDVTVEEIIAEIHCCPTEF